MGLDRQSRPNPRSRRASIWTQGKETIMKRKGSRSGELCGRSLIPPVLCWGHNEEAGNHAGLHFVGAVSRAARLV